MPQFFHSVTLNEELCHGCTTCIKRCPTEAIRVRNGKAVITSERCIDCGECIRVCPHHAKSAKSDKLSIISRFTYKIVLPAPSLYGQFNNLDDIDYVLAGLLKLGFDEVYEVSAAAELVSDATRNLMERGKLQTPVISSACPAVVRLIRLKFPDLCGYVLPLLSPMEIAARTAKRQAANRLGLPVEEIGAFFISPCPAKVTDIRAPIGIQDSWVDGVFSMNEIYPKLLETMTKKEEPSLLSHSGLIGVSWGSSGGEASALIQKKYLAADGIENVMGILEALEDGRLRELEFIELNACPGGCVGGVLTVENPFVARARIQQLRKYLPVSLTHLDTGASSIPNQMCWQEPLESADVLRLSDDLGEAMEMMEQIDLLYESLPKLDCGSCGAPSCRALAEDVICGKAGKYDCIFVLREELKKQGVSIG